MRKAILGSVAALLFLSVPTFAQTYRSDIREHRQESRIERGVRTGQLTPHEAYRLDRQQVRIRHLERRSREMNGGYLDRHTRRKIERIQDRASHRIRRLKHNRRHY